MNGSGQSIPQLAVQFNKNYLGVNPVSVAVDMSGDGNYHIQPPSLTFYIVSVGASKTVQIPMIMNAASATDTKMGVVQIALKTSLGVLYFASPLSAHIFFEENAMMDKKEFLQMWQTFGTDQEQQASVSPNTFNKDSLSKTYFISSCCILILV